MSISVGDAVLKITGDTSNVDKSISGLGGKLSGLGSVAKGAGIALAGMGVAAVGAGIAATTTWAKAGGEIFDLTKKTGFGAQALSEYKYMAEQSGASLGTMETAIKKMQMAIGGAGDKTKGATEEMKALQEELDAIKQPDRGVVVMSDTYASGILHE